MIVGDLVKHRDEDCLSSGSVEATKGYGTGMVISDDGWYKGVNDVSPVYMYTVWWANHEKTWEPSHSLEIVSES